jgi:EAL domain-containing protein (putative c-di-GMP-specific phosphodiesterase class I)
MNCDVAQGYFFARPLTSDALAAWMEARPGAALAGAPADRPTSYS